MKLFYFTFVFSFIFSFFSFADVTISQFTWDDNTLDPKVADIGPDGTSISANAYIDANGVAGTTGLNAGPAKVNIHLIIPGFYYDVDGLETSIYYQREENSAWFFTRGNNWGLGIKNGKIRINYRVDDGMGGYNHYAFNNIYNVPDDDVWRLYSLRYDHNTGTATVSVDGVIVWTNVTGPAKLYWGGASNMIIGRYLDGTGRDKTTIDDAKIIEVVDVTPLSSLNFSFGVKNKQNVPNLIWYLDTEELSGEFIVEKSTNGVEFESIDFVNINSRNNKYNFVDHSYVSGTLVYYRVIVSSTRGQIISNVESFKEGLKQLSVYPTVLENSNVINVQSEDSEINSVAVHSINGQLVSSVAVENEKLYLDSNLPKGYYILTFYSGNEFVNSTKILIK